MGILDGILQAAGGNLVKSIGDIVTKYFPPDMSPEQKASMQLEIERMAMEREKNLNDAMRDAEQAINERVSMYEGTAKDLANMPILGPVMLFLRGGQRIIIGYAVVVLDYQVFSGAWRLPMGTLENCFWIINLLVLGFLFGERAIKNVAPLISDVLASRVK